MQAASKSPSLAVIASVPYIDAQGKLPQDFEGRIGVYAIYTSEGVLVYIGYSRDVSLSLKQHLVRQPQACGWVKVYTVERPNRALLEEIKATWIAENGEVPVGNDTAQSSWEQPIDAKTQMLPAESAQYNDPHLDDQQRQVALKQAARRIEQEILTELATRGLQDSLRFNPKLKENGLLDLK